MEQLKIEYRQFTCDKCGCFNFTSMTFYDGNIELKETNFYQPPDYQNKVKLYFKNKS